MSEANPIDRLVMLRKQAGITQAELARKSGLTPAAISKLEAGKSEPTLNTALKIAKALNVSVYALSGEVEYPSNEFSARCELTKAQQRLAKIAQIAAT